MSGGTEKFRYLMCRRHSLTEALADKNGYRQKSIFNIHEMLNGVQKWPFLSHHYLLFQEWCDFNLSHATSIPKYFGMKSFQIFMLWLAARYFTHFFTLFRS